MSFSQSYGKTDSVIVMMAGSFAFDMPLDLLWYLGMNIYGCPPVGFNLLLGCDILEFEYLTTFLFYSFWENSLNSVSVWFTAREEKFTCSIGNISQVDT